MAFTLALLELLLDFGEDFGSDCLNKAVIQNYMSIGLAIGCSYHLFSPDCSNYFVYMHSCDSQLLISLAG